jgi:hypothetical protein
MRPTQFSSDESMKRLRWVMLAVILFDNVNTLFGQPATYWSHPETVQEGNRLTHIFISKGWAWFVGYEIVYMSMSYLLACIPSRRIALTVMLSFIFGHYYGASTWLAHRWHLGTEGTVIYAIALSAILVAVFFYPHSHGATRDEKA